MNERLRNSGEQEPHKPLSSAFRIAHVDDTSSLAAAYLRQDQRLMIAGTWDYEDSSQFTNKVKDAILEADMAQLAQNEVNDCRYVLWLWYHHAITCALWKRHDKQKARLFSERAMMYMSDDNPNRITKLLYLLTHDRLDEAQQWIDLIAEDQEIGTAIHQMELYKSYFLR